jgi:hypothetical protein
MRENSMRRRRLNKNWKPRNNPNDGKMERMLNIRALPYFKYDLQHYLDDSKMEENIKRSLRATLLSKASRISIKDAKLYLTEKAEEEMIDDKMRDDLTRLLDKYAKFR